MQTIPHVRPTIPASDMQRARRFYEETLGFRPKEVDDQGVMYEGSDGSTFLVFPSMGHASGDHTQVSFEVDEVDREVRDLKAKGVAFEHVEMEGFDPQTSIVSTGDMRAAWFKDTEGNLLAVGNRFTS